MAGTCRGSAMRTRIGVLVGAAILSIGLPVSAGAGPIEIGPEELSYATTLTVKNGTDAPVTFNRIANTCVPDAPESFTVGVGETWTATVTQKHRDDGLDNCYVAHHSIVYADAASAGNTFGVQQYNNSSDPACLDITIFVLATVGQAICPVAQGSLSGPTSIIQFAPGSQEPHVVTSCPGDLPGCRDQWGRTQVFGFYISLPEAFTVTAVNGTGSVDMTCTLNDQAAVQDANACVTENASVPVGGQAAMSLAGSCGKYYRLADRTNVQLECDSAQQGQPGGPYTSYGYGWGPVTNGSSYTLMSR